MKNLPALLALWASMAACGSAPASEAASATTGTTPTATTSMEPTATPPAAPRYDVRGIFDPGLGGIIALAIKVPHGWKVQQSYKRNWIGAYPLDQLYVGVFSPDGHQAFEALPEMRYNYSTSPQAQQMAQQMERWSGQHDESIRAPMLAVPYLKQVLLPLLAQVAKMHPRVVAEHEDAVKQPQPGLQQANGYLDCLLPSGRKLRIEMQINLVQTPMGQSWGASATLIQTDGDLAAAVAQQHVILKSTVANPEWVRKNQELQSRGMDTNTEQAKASLQRLQAQQKVNNEQFQQRMAAQRQQFDQHNANWVAQQHANDQSSQAFRDYLGGQTLYQNAETGQRTHVDNTYSHVYQDGQGHTLATNAPLSAGNVNWQELQQVELKNY